MSKERFINPGRLEKFNKMVKDKGIGQAALGSKAFLKNQIPKKQISAAEKKFLKKQKPLMDFLRSKAKFVVPFLLYGTLTATKPAYSQDKRFSVGILCEVGQPAYTSLKAEHEEYNKLHKNVGDPSYIPSYKDLTNPGLLNMLGAEVKFALTKNLNLTGSFSTSIGNEWNYDATYNENGYKEIISKEKADILEGKLGLEGNIEAGNWTFN